MTALSEPFAGLLAWVAQLRQADRTTVLVDELEDAVLDAANDHRAAAEIAALVEQFVQGTDQ